jgi:Right handed beta helix region
MDRRVVEETGELIRRFGRVSLKPAPLAQAQLGHGSVGAVLVSRDGSDPVIEASFKAAPFGRGSVGAVLLSRDGSDPVIEASFKAAPSGHGSVGAVLPSCDGTKPAIENTFSKPTPLAQAQLGHGSVDAVIVRSLLQSRDRRGRAKRVCLCIFLLLLTTGCGGSAEKRLRKTLATQVTGTIQLPSGVIELSSELTLAPGAHDLEIIGPSTLLKAADDFQGRALIAGESARHIALRGFSLQGSQTTMLKPQNMAPPENAFRIYYKNNGVLFDQVDGLEITELHFRSIAGFSILASRSSGIRITRARVEDSGSHNAAGRNNTTGGIVIEEGSSDFEVRDCTLLRIGGNGVWTHSLFTSPRLHDGVIANNRFDTIGRDAIEVGHATRVRVEDNSGAHIGFPVDVVDVENGGTPVTVDTAGNVDQSLYARNKFEDVNGKCIDLDGFHDGAVRENQCVSRQPAASYPSGHFGIVMNNTDPNTQPVNVEILNNTIDGTKFGALFLMGSNNRVTGNTFLHINTSECNESAAQFGCVYKADEPKMLESGIYLGRGVARMVETRGNVIRGNKISGHKMKSRCIATGPGVSLSVNIIDGNKCEDYSTARK